MKRVFLTIATGFLIVAGTANPILGQRASATEKSFLRARGVLKGGIDAIGGLQQLQKIADVTREMSGTRSDQGQGMWPVSSTQKNRPPVTSRFSKATSIRDLRGRRAMEYRETVIFGGQPLTFRNVVTPNSAFFANYITRAVYVSQPGPNPGAGLFRRYPESLLQTAWNRPETLRWIGESVNNGRAQRVISFADSDGTQVALFFDARSNLLTKTETLGDDPILGDVTTEIIYSDWRLVNKVRLPFRYVDRVDGAILFDMHVISTALNQSPTESLFTLPEGLAKIDSGSQGQKVQKLADSVYALLGLYNSIFVVFKDHVLVIEAGVNSRYSEASIAEIKKVSADKPIRYLVSTHFHFDHLGGVRSFIAEGTTIITTPSAKAILEKAVTARHVMRPDALSRNPKTPVFETINDRRVFDDGTQRVELYRFRSPHVGEMIIAYLPAQKLLFEADLLDIPERGFPPAGEDTVDLAQQIRKLGLEVDTIVPVHGRLGSFSDLQSAISGRTMKKMRGGSATPAQRGSRYQRTSKLGAVKRCEAKRDVAEQ